MSSPCQIFSSTAAKDIWQSPVNTSTSKHNWSFCKDQRFKKPKVNCDNFYEILGISNNKNRKAGFGYGKKTDLQVGKDPHNIAPSPDTYNISSFTQINKNKQKGFTPLFSRQQIAPMSYIDLEKIKVPGPGRYDVEKDNQSPRYSLGRKLSQGGTFKINQSQLITPSPDKYDNPEAISKNLTGKYHTSRYRNSSAVLFNPKRSARFKPIVQNSPPLGTYNPKNDLSGIGVYVLSKNKSAGKRTFMMGRRTSFTSITAKRSQTPGPGSYRKPSDFGHYDSKAQRKSRIALNKSEMMKSDKMKETGLTTTNRSYK